MTLPIRSCAAVAAVFLLTGWQAKKAAESADSCNVLTPADIKAVTGVEVEPLPRGSSPGAGGCANFKTHDGNAYLGVNRYRGSGKYQTAVGSVPESVYPKRTPVTGLGDEAVLMKDETGMLRYLVARKGETTVVLFPLSAARKMSDDQLRQLAERALAAK
jgi:hypothetical protein